MSSWLNKRCTSNMWLINATRHSANQARHLRITTYWRPMTDSLVALPAWTRKNVGDEPRPPDAVIVAIARKHQSGDEARMGHERFVMRADCITPNSLGRRTVRATTLRLAAPTCDPKRAFPEETGIGKAMSRKCNHPTILRSTTHDPLTLLFFLFQHLLWDLFATSAIPMGAFRSF